MTKAPVRQYQLQLMVSKDEMRICIPSGHYWAYPVDQIPSALSRITIECLADDNVACIELLNSVKAADDPFVQAREP